jgi:hypothetical protein
MTKGLYDNIHAKRKRIAAGSGEKMRKPSSKGAPSANDFKKSAKTSRRYLKKKA